MEKITLENFALKTVIGKGSYAKVVLVKKIVILVLISEGHQRSVCYENTKKEKHRKKKSRGACTN